MMKSYLIKIVLCLPLCFLLSCNSDEVNRSVNSSDVYVSGQKSDHACYWKNNTLNLLDDAGFSTSFADTIIEVNNDVHILGYGNNGFSKQIYWKNNIVTNLTDSFSTSTELVNGITGMDIVGNDVYFSGITIDITVTPNTYNLVYWKNGVKTIVTSLTSLPYYNLGRLKVLNNDVYISGPQENSGVFTDGYYENNTFHPYSNLIWGINSNNSEIYFFGRGANYTDGYYKNLTSNVEINITSISPIVKMCFDNGNVYVRDDWSIFENGNSFYTIPTPTQPVNFYRIEDFFIKNSITYLLLDEDLTTNNYVDQKVLIDNIVTMQNNPDEVFKCIFVD